MDLEDESPPGERRGFWYYKPDSTQRDCWKIRGNPPRVYDKLVGRRQRGEEAKARLNNIRLEHFLWTD
jgi:hypothetical protein